VVAGMGAAGGDVHPARTAPIASAAPATEVTATGVERRVARRSRTCIGLLFRRRDEKPTTLLTIMVEPGRDRIIRANALTRQSTLRYKVVRAGARRTRVVRGEAEMDTTTHQDEVDDDGPAPDPREMHALMEEQRRVAVDAQTSFVWVMEICWGAAWLLGYTALWLIDGSEAVSLPLPVAVGIFAGLILASSIVSVVLGVRGSAGIATTGEGRWQGRVYGISWSVAMVSVYVLGIGLAFNDAPSRLLSIYFTSGFSFVAGLMLLSTAALFHSRSSLLLGSILVVAALAAPFAGYPGNYLAMAVLGGGAYLVTGITAAVLAARARRSLRARLA
jgi:hypothetical protein